MKTSFYFVLWIVIYPLLDLLHNPVIDEHSFIIALLSVWGLSWLLNKIMPETIIYSRKLDYAGIMDEVYTCNVDGFRRRLRRMSIVEFVGALYFGVTFLLTLVIMIGGGEAAVFELLIFGMLAAGTIVRAAKLQKYAWRLRRNPDPQESVEIVEEMNLDYAGYYEDRQNSPNDSALPPAPRYFGVFQIVSTVFAVICALLGIAFVTLALAGMVSNISFGATTFGLIFLLYGSLATYYGIKDCISSLNYFKLRSYITPAA